MIGAFGKRAATLEATGDWAAIGDDGSMEALTGAGLFGKALSVAPTLPRLMSLEYSGHVLRDGRKAHDGRLRPAHAGGATSRCRSCC